MKQKTGCTVLFLHSIPTTGMLLPQTEVYCVFGVVRNAIYTVLCIYIKEIDIHVYMYKNVQDISRLATSSRASFS